MASTIALRLFSSSSRKEFIFVGSVICICASNSVFLTSRAHENSAIFAFSTFLGMRGWTRSLSITIPFIMHVLPMFSPIFF